MSINKSYRYILCGLTLLSLSACGSIPLKPFGTKSDKVIVTNNTENASEPTALVPVQKQNTINQTRASNIDSSIDIFDLELNPNYRRNVAQPSDRATAPSSSSSVLQYGEEFKTADTSVTIYGLDGDVPPHIGAQPYGHNNVPPVQAHNQGYGQSYDQSLGSVAGQIFFKHGSSRLGSGDLRKIKSLAEKAKFAPVNHITIEGFASKPTQAGTNTTQAHILNLRQSMKRSEKVSKALIRQGVPGEKLKTVSWGASKATGNNTQDRRVDVVIGER